MKDKIWNKTFNLGRTANKLLDSLVDAIEAGYILGREFSDIRGTFTPFWDELEEEREYFEKQAEKRRAILEFQRRRLIEEKKIGDKVLYFLTDKGTAELARQSILNCDKYLDGKLCLIVFDIPETQRHIRDLFRRFLKEAGLKYVQQSVWITNKDVAEKFRDFIKAIQAEQWINIFIVDEIILAPSKNTAKLFKNFVSRLSK